jgi:phospholipid/cholesterol/gamma-HCH transport system substrate-binding protein
MRRVKQRGPSPLVMGAICLVLVAIGLYFAQTKEVPFRNHFELKAAFASSNGVRAGSPVRIAGVNVGKVVHTQPYGDDASLVTMRISSAGLPIHRDARLKIRPRLFLEGNFFVDVQPGSPSAPVLHDGDVIPATQTARPVQLDQVLDTLDNDTRDQVQTVLDEFGRALHRGAAATNRTFRYTGPAYRDSAIVSDAQLGDSPHQLSGYLRDAGTVSRALDRDPRALQDLITALYGTARGFARESDALESTLAELPVTLRTGLPALRELNRAFPSLRRLIGDLRPALRTSVPALDAGIPLARQLRGLVSEPELRGLVSQLRSSTPDLVRFNKANVPLGEQTRLIASCNNDVLIPWGNQKVPDPNFPARNNINAEGARTLVGLSGESRSGDANGQWFRALVSTGNYTYQLNPGEFLTTGEPILGTNPPPARQMPPLRPDVPCETQQTPDLRTIAGPPPQRLETKIDPAREARAQKIAVDWLRKQVSSEGYKGILKVSDTPLTAGELQTLRRHP